MGMIYCNSNHPVEIKKIRLKVWTLREEINFTYKEKIKEGLTPNQALSYVQGVYHGLIKLPPSVEQELSAVSGNIVGSTDSMTPDSELDDSEDEMAKALAEAEAGEAQESQEESTENSPEENSESSSDQDTIDNVVELNADKNQKSLSMTVSQSIEAISEVESVGNLLLLKRNRPKLSDGKIGDIVTILTDINMDMISCFSTNEYLFGQTIILEFLVPNPFFVTAEVLECRNYNMKSRVISNQRPKYRLHAKFIFPREGERTMLRRFLKSVEPEIPIEAPKAAKPKDDDDLGDLEDLGL